ncbi:hypothetical protein [Streptomyces sp. NPDC057682]|uniref:hypothetical protein n=1 Tax=Streptomyces sp. NPDC057682 TaxID=3346210 RepID=UPI0036CEE9A7
MGGAVPVRCPACRRDHAYVPPAYACPCGAPAVPPLLRGAPVAPVTHRTWTDDWVTVRCLGCGRHDQWPQPELCCPCGAVLRLPVRPVAAPGRPSAASAPSGSSGPSGPTRTGGTDATGRTGPTGRTNITGPSHIPLPRTAPAPRPPFRPVAIRSARDAVAAAARYLTWLGYRDVTRSAGRPASRIDLRAAGAIAQVDATTRPSTRRDVECLWLHALNSSVTGVFFSLAGYAPDAGERADALGVPLFTMDPTGRPHPLNGPADDLLGTGP